jgi:hypothetical protein
MRLNRGFRGKRRSRCALHHSPSPSTPSIDRPPPPSTLAPPLPSRSSLRMAFRADGFEDAHMAGRSTLPLGITSGTVTASTATLPTTMESALFPPRYLTLLPLRHDLDLPLPPGIRSGTITASTGTSCTITAWTSAASGATRCTWLTLSPLCLPLPYPNALAAHPTIGLAQLRL